MRKFTVILVVLILTISCRKERSYNVIGKYDCQVTTSWVQNYPTFSSGFSINQEIIEVKKKCCKKGEIEVLEGVIIIDESKKYHGDHDKASWDTFDIRFTNDSVYISYAYDGGHAGGNGYNYKGRKVD